MQLTGKTADGPVICDVASWFKHAPPAKGAAQWKDYRSAKELARAWCRYGEVRCPEEIATILKSQEITKGLLIDQVVAEMEIPFDEFRGGKRNADLALWGRQSRGTDKVVVTVEAKADEEYGKTIQKQLQGAPVDRGSKIPERVARLSKGVLGRDVDDEIQLLRYQLLHALAATAKLAQDKQAAVAVLLVHEFVSLTTDFDRFVSNANDLSRFVRAIPGWETETLSTGKLLRPIHLPGSDSVPTDILVSVGKVRTLLPPGSAGRMAVTEFPLSSGQFLELE